MIGLTTNDFLYSCLVELCIKKNTCQKISRQGFDKHYREIHGPHNNFNNKIIRNKQDIMKRIPKPTLTKKSPLITQYMLTEPEEKRPTEATDDPWTNIDLSKNPFEDFAIEYVPLQSTGQSTHEINLQCVVCCQNCT